MIRSSSSSVCLSPSPRLGGSSSKLLSASSSEFGSPLKALSLNFSESVSVVKQCYSFEYLKQARKFSAFDLGGITGNISRYNLQIAQPFFYQTESCFDKYL